MFISRSFNKIIQFDLILHTSPLVLLIILPDKIGILSMFDLYCIVRSPHKATTIIPIKVITIPKSLIVVNSDLNKKYDAMVIKAILNEVITNE